jgi:hypothetical protein
MEVFKELEDRLAAVEKKFAGADWKSSLNEICNEVRQLGTEFAQQQKIKGFVLEANGADASRQVAAWPSVVFESGILHIKMLVSALGRTGHMTVSFGDTVPQPESSKADVSDES